MKHLIVLGLLSLSLSSCGCNTPQCRTEQQNHLFVSYPQNVQNNIRAGRIAIGYTQTQVQMALGDPDKATTDGAHSVWHYYTTDYSAYSLQMPQEEGPPNAEVVQEVEIEHYAPGMVVEFKDGLVTKIRRDKN